MVEGLFIVLEGIEGSGKSSQIELLADYLSKEGYSVITTQEPGGTRIGEVVRDVLLSPEDPKYILPHWVTPSGSAKTELTLETKEHNGHRVHVSSESGQAGANGTKYSPQFEEMDYKTELLLYAADRNQHIKEVITPALKEGKIVICDRFSLSTFAYQGFGRGIDQGEIRQVEALATGGLEPDFTVIFDVPVGVGLKRATKHYTDRIEHEEASFHQRVRDGYLQLARQNPGGIRVVDGTKSKEEIHQELVGIVEELLQDAGVKGKG